MTWYYDASINYRFGKLMTMNRVEWGDVAPEVVDFIFYQAEKHLEAQFQSGIASDARAITAASILTGLSGVVFAGAVGLWVLSPIAAVQIASVTLGGMLLLAAHFCFSAAKPVDFYVPGNQPEEWYGCLKSPIHESKGVEVENYQEMISDNAVALDKAADHLLVGMRIAIFSPIAAALACLIIYVIS